VTMVWRPFTSTSCSSPRPTRRAVALITLIGIHRDRVVPWGSC
jgi:hypothetical protein